MVPRDFCYKNLSVAGRLATGKLTFETQTQTNIVASGPNTIFKKTFSMSDFDSAGLLDFNISIDATRSILGDQVSCFFVVPSGDYTLLRIHFSDNVYITSEGETNPEICKSYTINPPNTRFLLNMVYSGDKFINTNDTT